MKICLGEKDMRTIGGAEEQERRGGEGSGVRRSHCEVANHVRVTLGKSSSWENEVEQ